MINNKKQKHFDVENRHGWCPNSFRKLNPFMKCKCVISRPFQIVFYAHRMDPNTQIVPKFSTQPKAKRQFSATAYWQHHTGIGSALKTLWKEFLLYLMKNICDVPDSEILIDWQTNERISWIDTPGYNFFPLKLGCMVGVMYFWEPIFVDKKFCTWL